MAWLYSGPHVRVALPFPNALIAPTLTILRAPVDAVAEVGGNVHAGQPVLVIAESASSGCRSTCVKIGCTTLRRVATVDVVRPGTRVSALAVVTELVPLASFATWHAERAGGDHLENRVRKSRLRGAVQSTGLATCRNAGRSACRRVLRIQAATAKRPVRQGSCSCRRPCGHAGGPWRVQ